MGSTEGDDTQKTSELRAKLLDNKLEGGWVSLEDEGVAQSIDAVLIIEKKNQYESGKDIYLSL